MEKGDHSVLYIIGIIFCIIGIIGSIIASITAVAFLQIFRREDITKSKGPEEKRGGLCEEVPEVYKTIFVQAGDKWKVQPAYIAAIFVIEHGSPLAYRPGYTPTNSGGRWPEKDGDPGAIIKWETSSKGALGPFQFEPPTWEDHKQDGNNDGLYDVQNIWDAAFGAAHKLAMGGAGGNTTAEDDLRRAAYSYNHSQNYVENVIKEFNKLYCPEEKGLVTPSAPSKVGKFAFPEWGFKQWDPDWANHRYGFGVCRDATLAFSGCGPTALAMILKFYGKPVKPPDVADKILAVGGRVCKSGTAPNGIIEVAKQYGFTAIRKNKNDWNEVKTQFLKKGKPVIANVGPGHFTDDGHYIVLAGIDQNGEILINDPDGIKRPDITHISESIIISEAKYFIAIAPKE